MRKRHIYKFIMNVMLIAFIIRLIPTTLSANFTLSKSNVTLEEGKNQTITINGATVTGRIDIVSSNDKIASVNTSSIWIENNSQNFIINAKSQGKATITISGELYDSETEEERIYTKTINVTVNKVVSDTIEKEEIPPIEKPNNQEPNNNNQSQPNNSKPSANNSSATNITQKPTITSKPTQSNINNSEEKIGETIQENNIEENVSNELEETINEENKENIGEEVEYDIENNESELFKIDVSENKIEKTKNKNNNMFIICSIIGIALVLIIISLIIIKRIYRK